MTNSYLARNRANANKILRLLALLGIIIVSLAIGFIIGLEKSILIAILIFPIVGLFFFIYPKRGLFVLLILEFVIFWLTDDLKLLPGLFSVLPYVLVSIMVLSVLMITILGRKRTFQRTPFDVQILILIILALFSSVSNGVSPSTAISGFIVLVGWVFLFYLIVNLQWQKSDLQTLVIIVMGLGFVQIPVSIWQYLSGRGPDLITGTLGHNVSGQLGIFCASIFFVFAFQWMNNKKPIYLFLLPLSIIPIFLASVRAAFIYIPIGLIVMLVLMRVKIKNLLGIAILVIVLSFAMSVAWKSIQVRGITDRYYDYKDLIINLPDLIQEERGFAKDGSLARFGLWKLAQDTVIRGGFSSISWGYGIGSASPASMIGESGWLWKRYYPNRIHVIESVKTLLELGYLGLLLKISIYIRFFLFAIATARDKKNDKFYRALASAFAVITVIVMMNMWIVTVWGTDIVGFTYWFLAGVVFVWYKSYVRHSDSKNLRSTLG